jgi:hypothetical protein
VAASRVPGVDHAAYNGDITSEDWGQMGKVVFEANRCQDGRGGTNHARTYTDEEVTRLGESFLAPGLSLGEICYGC